MDEVEVVAAVEVDAAAVAVAVVDTVAAGRGVRVMGAVGANVVVLAVTPVTT